MASLPGNAVPQLAVDAVTGRPKKLPPGGKKPNWAWTGWFGFGGTIAVSFGSFLTHRFVIVLRRLGDAVESLP